VCWPEITQIAERPCYFSFFIVEDRRRMRMMVKMDGQKWELLKQSNVDEEAWVISVGSILGRKRIHTTFSSHS